MKLLIDPAPLDILSLAQLKGHRFDEEVLLLQKELCDRGIENFICLPQEEGGDVFERQRAIAAASGFGFGFDWQTDTCVHLFLQDVPVLGFNPHPFSYRVAELVKTKCVPPNTKFLPTGGAEAHPSFLVSPNKRLIRAFVESWMEASCS